MRQLIDITGKKFNKLIPVEYIGNSMWLCTCDCGGITVAKSVNIRKGGTKSCGCLRGTGGKCGRKGLVYPEGKRFGNLLVIKEIEKDPNHHRYYLCRCDCGREAVVSQQHLASGIKTSCRYCMWGGVPRKEIINGRRLYENNL